MPRTPATDTPAKRIDRPEGHSLPIGGALRVVTRDGSPVWQLRCPGCGHWGDIDEDQLHGRVSCDHAGCGVCVCAWHETVDFAAMLADRGA